MLNQYAAAKTPLRDRLLASRRITPAGCWEWTSACTDAGYGRMSWQGHVERVHRLAAHLWLGLDLRSETKALHRCDNPPCFRPSHLRLGTLADNSQDMVSKGRNYVPQRREKCRQGSHPLTDQNVIISSDPRTGRTYRRCRACFNAARRARRASDLAETADEARAYVSGGPE